MRLLLLFCSLALCGAAKADGIGTTVDGSLTSPYGPKNYYSPASLTIGGGQSFEFNDLSVQFYALFDGSTLTLTNDYNGYGLTALSASFTDPIFTGFTPVTSLPAGVSYGFSGDTLTVNLPSLAPNEVIVFDYTSASAAPEPSSLALLLTGILGVAGAARRRFPERQ